MLDHAHVSQSITCRRHGTARPRVEVPAGTLQDEELRVYIEALAKECDRFEYALRGWDRE